MRAACARLAVPCSALCQYASGLRVEQTAALSDGGDVGGGVGGDTVLAEFSSVVTNTQHYIVADPADGVSAGAVSPPSDALTHKLFIKTDKRLNCIMTSWMYLFWKCSVHSTYWDAIVILTMYLR